MTEHPGLGEPIDIDPQAAVEQGQAEAAPPASSDASQMEDTAGLGTGDGADPQPGGEG